MSKFYNREKEFIKQIHPSAEIASTAKISEEVSIGKNVVIHDFVKIYPNVIIDDEVEVFEGVIIGKRPQSMKIFSRTIETEFKPTFIGKKSVIFPYAIVYSDVQISDNTFIGEKSSIREECKIGINCIIGRNVNMNFNTKIGNNTKILDNTTLAGNMEIGSNVFISAAVNSANDKNFGSLGFHDEIKGPTIEDFVSIGLGANILSNLNIGKHSIVAAGAVVTKDVPPKKMVMGIPAKVVRDLN